MWHNTQSLTTELCVGLYLCVEVVGETLQELALDGVLLSQERQVMAQLFMGRDDGSFTVLIKLWPSSATEDLHDVQDAQIHQCTTLGIVDISALISETRESFKAHPEDSSTMFNKAVSQACSEVL